MKTSKQRAFFILIIFHIIVIASSNYLVQLPVNVIGFNTTWGAFTFPFIFLSTDLTVRIFGASLARKIILVVMLPALLISYLISIFFMDGHWVGWHALLQPNIFVMRIALASFMAYVIGQFMDIFVFNHLRKLPQWWFAPSASMILGNAIDTIAFFGIAFYKTDNQYFTEHLFEIAFVDYSFKIIVCLFLFVPLYGVLLKQIIKYILSGQDHLPVRVI